jgi:ATP synthase subunit 6
MLFSALEQFQLLGLKCCTFMDLSITNQTIILLLIFIFTAVIFLSLVQLSKDKKTLGIIPTNWQVIFEIIFKLVTSVVTDNIKEKNGGQFFPFVSTLFFFILCVNLIGLVPYSYTLTSQLVITLTLSISIFIGINILSVKKHGLKFFALFLPGGTSVPLSLLLVPIELLSYIFKPISLSIRLFANMMAGHTLLKVIVGFSVSMISTQSKVLLVLSFVPLLILLPLFALELAVALIQTFVYAVLICIYIQDALAISH